MRRDYDVVIVGSGPAGCSTALHLARLSPSLRGRVAVLEKSSHPRHKLCGGGLVWDVDTILRDLGLDLSEVPHVDAKWAHLLWHGRGLRMNLGDIAFHVVRRREFDAWLAARVRDCGIAVHEQTEVLSLRRDAEGIELSTSRGVLRARAVVGADGSKGLCRRAVAGDAGATARLLEVMIPPPAGCTAPPGEATFEFRHVPAGVQGYFWNFPMEIEGRPMRNLGVYDSRVRAEAPSAGSLKGYLERELELQGVRLCDCKVEGHPIHLFSRRSALSAPHIVLAGDAAGADPLLGEGIGPALGYGELAARALVDAFARDDFGFADYTRRVHESRLGRSLRKREVAARLLYAIKRPALHRLVWWHLQPLVRRFVYHHVFRWARPSLPLAQELPRVAGEPARAS
ncbi:MAG TPA: FAD-dependent oxidoreductase [Nannocystis sp.]